MSEFGEVMRLLFQREGNSNQIELRKVRIKNDILKSIQENLGEASGVSFEFEIKEKDLPYAVEVINSPEIQTLYEVSQISNSVFSATLREIGI